jgi:hypothetical protein
MSAGEMSCKCSCARYGRCARLSSWGSRATLRYAAATKKGKLDPSSDLNSGRTYKATVTSGAQDLVGNALDQNPNIANNQSKSWKLKVQQEGAVGSEELVYDQRKLEVVDLLDVTTTQGFVFC